MRLASMRFFSYKSNGNSMSIATAKLFTFSYCEWERSMRAIRNAKSKRVNCRSSWQNSALISEPRRIGVQRTRYAMYALRRVDCPWPLETHASDPDTKYLVSHKSQARNTSVCVPLEIYEFADAHMRDEHTR